MLILHVLCQPPLKSLAESHFLTYKRKANFVAYIPFFVIEKEIDKILQCSHFFVQRVYPWRTMILATLKRQSMF